MFRRSVIKFLFVAAVVLGGTLLTSAQVTSGTVEMESDGKREPVAGALVEPFRTDVKGGSPSTKTNAKGQFSFAGFQLGQTYILVVSAPGMAPAFYPNVRAGQERILITLIPGDGRRLTEEEAKKLAASPQNAQTPQNAEELKKAQAEYEKQKKEIEEKNKKAENTNAITNRAIKEGKAAMDAKNFDLAIAKYQEGYEADTTFVGSAPVFLLNMGIAHVERAVELHNSSLKSDLAERAATGEIVKKHLLDALKGYQQALLVQKNAPASDISDKANFDQTKIALFRAAGDAFKRAVDTERVDPEMIELAKAMIPEYLAVETDAARKMQINLNLADMYRIREERENAIAGYKKVLELNPEHVDALVYVGIVLVDLAWLKDNDKALSQEGANYLQKFVSVAPDTHRMKTGAAEYLAILKEQSVVPTKTPAPPRRRP